MLVLKLARVVMHPQIEQAIKDARTILVSRLVPLSEKLGVIHAATGADNWYSDSLMHLFSELTMAHSLLELTYNDERQLFILGKPSILAWRARNLLELSIWIYYFCHDRKCARRFYDDQARDMFDMMDGFKKLIAVMPTTEQSLHEVVQASKTRIAELAALQGMSDLDEQYTRVFQAARELQVGEFFASVNKFLSKFAHPTALIVFTFQDETHRAEMCEFFFAFGAIFFTVSFGELEQHVQKTCKTTGRAPDGT
jgi:hypothetical protein